jgi:hypothetical protein
MRLTQHDGLDPIVLASLLQALDRLGGAAEARGIRDRALQVDNGHLGVLALLEAVFKDALCARECEYRKGLSLATLDSL